jgi:hypothetical protein
MKPQALLLVAALTLSHPSLSVDKAQASPVSWNVDPVQSYIRLSIPDQSVVIDGTSVTMRLRGANNAAWSDSNGARAFLDGTIATELQPGSIEFLGSAHNLFALESGSYRPSPAQWDPNATNVDNPDGQYIGTDGAPAAFAAKARGSVLLITPDLAYLAFRSVQFDVDSGAIPLAYNFGGATFAGGTNSFGIQSAAIDIDGLAAQLVGQPVPDMRNKLLSDLIGWNVLGGTIVNFTSFGPELTLLVNTPIAIEVDGVPLQAIVSGQIVAYTTIPEPSSILLAGCAAFGLFVACRRRLCRA